MFVARTTGGGAAGAATGSVGTDVGVAGGDCVGAACRGATGADAIAGAAEETTGATGAITAAGALAGAIDAGAATGTSAFALGTDTALGAFAALAVLTAFAAEAVAWLGMGSTRPASAAHIVTIRVHVRLELENRMVISDRPPFLDEFTPHPAQ